MCEMLLWSVMSFHEMGGRSDCFKYGMAWDLGEDGEQGKVQLKQ